MASFTVTVDISGPIFDGVAEEACNQATEAAVKEISQRADREIKAEAWTMNKSGRAGTGPGGFWAPTHVPVFDHGMSAVIYGEMVTYLGWWPWLEGTSKRNASTSFGGYHTFQRTAERWQVLGGMVLEDQVRARLPEMGG